MEKVQITMTADEARYLVDLIDICVDEEIDFPFEVYEIKSRIETAIEGTKDERND